MKFGTLQVQAEPHFIAKCPRCSYNMKECPEGWFSSVFYCKKCDDIYEVRLIKRAKKTINKKYLEKCREMDNST